MSAVTNELLTHHSVVLVEQLAPGPITELGGASGRFDDVAEQDGGQHAIDGDGVVGSGDEFLDLLDDRVIVMWLPAGVEVAWQHGEPGVGYAVGDLLRRPRWYERVVGHVQDEGGHSHGGQHGAHVQRRIGAVFLRRHGRRARVSLESGEGVSRGRTAVLHDQPLDQPGTPLRADPADEGVLLIGRHAGVGVRAVDDEMADTVGEGGGKQNRQRSAFGDADDRRSLQTAGVVDGTDVVHPVFQAADAKASIGESGPALVEGDQAAEALHPLDEPAPARQLALHLDVGHETRDPHNWRALADVLVGDGETLTVRVARLRSARHGVQPCRLAPTHRTETGGLSGRGWAGSTLDRSRAGGPPEGG